MDSLTAVHSLGHSILDPKFLLSSLSIILINIVLSGDNSIVIAMAVHGLPKDKRTKGLVIGTLGAVLLRVLFTLIASHLMSIPFLKLAGGLLILWIAVKLLLEEEDAEARHKPVETLWTAIWIILVADVTMSLDNVLAVAGASHGDVTELWLSLGFSIPLVVFASTLIARIMDRFPIVVFLGAALLGKVGGEMIYTDPILTSWFKLESVPGRLATEALGIGTVFLLTWLIRKRAAGKTPSGEA